MFLIVLLILVALMAGCVRSPVLVAAPPGLPPAAFDPVRLWEDASIFDAVRAAAGGAQHRLWVEMYEFDRQDLVDLLAAARVRGVDVRLIVDPSVAVNQATATRLRNAGVAARFYPLDERAHQIDHVKLLLTEAAAVLGGMNWGRRSAANHDYALESRSPPVLERLGSIYQQDWSLANGSPAPLGAAGGPIAQTAPGQEIRRQLGAALAAARLQVDVEIFVLTDLDLVAGLAGARARGARVRVLLDPNQAENRRAYQILQSGGVEARWYPVPRGTLLHAKAGLFDRRLILGSANWSVSGLGVNHELDMETADPGAVAAFRARFQKDWLLAGGRS